jgi:cell division protein FtsB
MPLSNEQKRRPPYKIRGPGRSGSSTKITTSKDDFQDGGLTVFPQLNKGQNTAVAPGELTLAEKKLDLVTTKELPHIKLELQAKKVEIEEHKPSLKAAEKSVKIAQEKLADHKTEFAKVVFAWVESRIDVLPRLGKSQTKRETTSKYLYKEMEKAVREREAQVEEIARLKAEGKKDEIVPPMHLNFDAYENAFNSWCRYNMPAEGGGTIRISEYNTTRDILRDSASKAEKELATLKAHASKLDEEAKQLQKHLKSLEQAQEDLHKPKVGSSGPVNDGETHQRSRSKVPTNANVLPATSPQPKIHHTPQIHHTPRSKVTAGAGSASTLEKRNLRSEKRSRTPEKRSRRGSTAKNTQLDKGNHPHNATDRRHV